jgi:hypothetical protein
MWTCYELLNVFLSTHWHPTLILSASVPIAFITFAWAHFFAQLFTPLGPSLSILITGIYLIIAFLTRLFRRRASPPKLPDSFYLLILASTVLMLIACHSSFLQAGYNSQGTTYSDLPFHMNLITSFAYGVNSRRDSFWPFRTTFYAFEPLVYPIIPDYHSTVLVTIGSSVRMSVFLPTFFLSVSIICSLYHLGLRFSTLRYVPELTVILFCFAGGDGWKRLFRNAEATAQLNTNYAHNFGDHETFWLHSLIHFLFPQRSAMFSITLCIVATIAIIDCVSREFQWLTQLAVAGFCIALLPMASGHSFLAICLLAALFAIVFCPWLTPRRWPRFLAAWIIFAVPIAVIGLPQSFQYVQRARRGEFIKIKGIWLDYGPPTVFTFVMMWWESLSVFVFLSVFHCWWAFSRAQAAVYAPAFGVFIVSNILRFQPGAMDNTKVFTVAWFPLACAAVAHLLVVVWRRAPWIAAALAITGTASGFLCVAKSLGSPFPVFSPQEFNAGLWAIENTPIESVFLTIEYPGCPVTAIAGRTALMTFPGWAWTHGVISNERVWAVQNLWNSPRTEYFHQYNTQYALRQTERSQMNWSVDPGDTGWLEVFAEKGVEIWEAVVPLLVPEVDEEPE